MVFDDPAEMVRAIHAQAIRSNSPVLCADDPKRLMVGFYVGVSWYGLPVRLARGGNRSVLVGDVLDCAGVRIGDVLDCTEVLVGDVLDCTGWLGGQELAPLLRTVEGRGRLAEAMSPKPKLGPPVWERLMRGAPLV
jgi:hypothetical protein